MAQPLSWVSNEGRNTWDHPLALPPDMSVDSLNVSLKAGTLGSKRLGTSAVTISGDSFSGINTLHRFVPGQDESAAQLFIGSDDATKKILKVIGATAVNLSLSNAISGQAQDVCSAQLNGKLFFTYKSGVNRMFVYDPAVDATLIRRAGQAAMAAPAVANTGSGGYAAVIRHYSIEPRVKSGSVILRRGNLSPVTTFTPSGTGTAARLTKPTATGDGETHWAIYASAIGVDGPFLFLAEVAVGTTTYDDSADPNAYTGAASPRFGSNYPMPAGKWIISDGARLIMLGAYETSAGDSVTPAAGRVYITPVLTSTGIGDDERFQSTLIQTDSVDLNINGGGVDRGLSRPMNNAIYAFQSKGIFGLWPTGLATAPYRRFIVTMKYGAVSHESIVMAEDESGNAACYFLNPEDGPRRITIGSQISWCGKDCKDLWDTINLSASIRVAHGSFNSKTKEIIWWIATGANNEPNACIVYNTALGRVVRAGDVRYGWSRWTGAIGAARCSLMFATTLATTRPLTDVPYCGNGTGTPLYRQDGATSHDHGTSLYQGSITSRAFGAAALMQTKNLMESYLGAVAAAGVTIRQTIRKNWGRLLTGASDVPLTAEDTEDRIYRKFESSDVSDAIAFQTILGDSAAADTAWTLERWDAGADVTGARS